MYERGFFFFFKWNNYFVQVILNTFAQMFSFETKTRHCDDFGSSGVYNLYQRARGFESPVHGQEKELCPKNLMKKKKKKVGLEVTKWSYLYKSCQCSQLMCRETGLMMLGTILWSVIFANILFDTIWWLLCVVCFSF